jgi:hypothetical protein
MDVPEARQLYLLLPVTGKYFGGWPGHIDMIVGLTPFEAKIPAGKVGQQPPVGATGEHAGNAYGRRPGAARESDATAPFPRAHLDL